MNKFISSENSIEAHALCRQLIKRHIKKCKAILEAGAGSGEMLRELSKTYNARACGIDPYETERDEVLVHFRPYGAEQLEKLPRLYDLIYTVHSLHHFTNPGLFLKGAGEKLSINGRLIIVDWRRGAKTGVYEKYYDLEEITEWMGRYNLKIIEKGITDRNLYIVAILKNRLLAAATADGENIFPGMFGRSPYFDIYSIQNDKEFKYIKRVTNIYAKTLQHLKTYDVYNEVSNCHALLAARIGKKGQERLEDLGINIFFKKGNTDRAIHAIVKELCLKNSGKKI